MAREHHDAESIREIIEELELCVGKLTAVRRTLTTIGDGTQKIKVQYQAEMERGIRGIGDFALHAERMARNAKIAAGNFRAESEKEDGAGGHETPSAKPKRKPKVKK